MSKEEEIKKKKTKFCKTSEINIYIVSNIKNNICVYVRVCVCVIVFWTYTS